MAGRTDFFMLPENVLTSAFNPVSMNQKRGTAYLGCN
jgi:hypothetical protein